MLPPMKPPIWLVVQSIPPELLPAEDEETKPIKRLAIRARRAIAKKLLKTHLRIDFSFIALEALKAIQKHSDVAFSVFR